MEKQTTTPVLVNVKTRDGKSRPGKVLIQSWDEGQRLKRTARVLAIGWGLAVFSVFLPIAHFILVPAFLIGTPIVAFFIHKQKNAIVGGESTCPSCDKNLPIAAGPQNWPLEDICASCHTHVLIEKHS